mgnify:CR=1 FL=1
MLKSNLKAAPPMSVGPLEELRSLLASSSGEQPSQACTDGDQSPGLGNHVGDEHALVTGDVLEVDGDLGQRNIQAASRAAASEQLLQSRQRCTVVHGGDCSRRSKGG